VLVQLTPTEDGTPPPALIKRLVKRMTTKIVLEQFNPSKTFEIAVKDVLTIHKVVGSGE
jgi:phage repressor protein C with HTH and peptisase S24 domain